MSAPHGTKRAAESALDGEQRLSKRFDLLNLDNTNKGARLYIPTRAHAYNDPAAAAEAAAATATTHPPAAGTPHRLAANAPPTAQRLRPAPDPDSMLVEDTPHRVYIHDLAAELSDTDSDSDHPVFLPDIEKHLSKIPRHVLLGPPPKPTEHNQMVLYNVPASLSLPHDQDIVRKAIVEARQRIRDRQVSGLAEPERVHVHVSEGDDADAMDLD